MGYIALSWPRGRLGLIGIAQYLRGLLWLAVWVAAESQAQVAPANPPASSDLVIDQRTHKAILRSVLVDRAEAKPGPLRGYMLALSFSPSFCKTPAGRQDDHRYQCQKNRFGFVLHGLWPQSAFVPNAKDHPFACGVTGDEPPLAPDLVARWIHLLPSARLMTRQWFKHGRCMPDAKTPDDYFRQAEGLARSLKLPELASGSSLTLAALKDDLIVRNPGLRRESLFIAWEARADGCDKDRPCLQEIRICYDLKWQSTSCFAPDRSRAANTADRKVLFVP